MIRPLYTLILIFFTGVCWAQSRGVLLTKITSDKDTTRMLYVYNQAGDKLVVDGSTVYRVATIKNDIYFIASTADSLKIGFANARHEVHINKDIYRLYPDYYTRFKQAVLVKHLVMAVLNLLQDGIGDYPIEAALPLLLFSPQTDKQIQWARITTKRSQSDEVTDTWRCSYHYNTSGKLHAVSAGIGKYIHFSKKIIYKGANISNIKTYLSIEDRQVTDKSIIYSIANPSKIKWHELVLEAGKNRETELTTTLTKKVLGPIKSSTK